jgi:hypothetical protein
MNIIELAREAGLGDLSEKCGFIFFQPGTEGLKRFAKSILEAAAQAAQDECPTPDGALCAAAIRALKGEQE